MKVKVVVPHNGRFGAIPVGEYEIDDHDDSLIADAYKEIPQIFEKPAPKPRAKPKVTRKPKA